MLSDRVLVSFGNEEKALRAKDREHTGLHGVGELFTRGDFRLHDVDVAVELSEVTGGRNARRAILPSPSRTWRRYRLAREVFVAPAAFFGTEIGPRNEIESMIRNG